MRLILLVHDSTRIERIKRIFVGHGLDVVINKANVWVHDLHKSVLSVLNHVTFVF